MSKGQVPAAEEETQQSQIQNNTQILEQEEWAIRDCPHYKEEYSDCTSYKARFHQYFIHGHSVDCEQWYTDYENCTKYINSDKKDLEAAKAIILSERERRNVRMKAHYANDTWQKRTSPPADWNKPLPDWLVKKNENSLLDQKSKELAGLIPPNSASSGSYCSIM